MSASMDIEVNNSSEETPKDNSIKTSNNNIINEHNSGLINQNNDKHLLTGTNSSQNDRLSWNEDIFNTLTIEECEKQFELFENDIDQVTENKDKLSLLRSCIELLNRLECTNKDLFSGKLLIFLARAIPLFDQSGVNPRSEFNIKQLSRTVTKNLQEIIEKNTTRDQQLSLMIEQDIEEGETISDDEDEDEEIGSGVAGNQNLDFAVPEPVKKPQPKKEDPDRVFERFWKLQHYLNQPNSIYDKRNWFTFQTHISTLIAKMAQPSKLNVWKLGTPYMTEAKSLYLQLNDINMRRCFLVQILIVFQYLELPNIDTRPSELTLDKMQLDWTLTMTDKIYKILDTLPNQTEGRRFLSLVRHILEREKMWNRWKNEKCKEPKLPEDDDEMVMMGPTYHKRRKMSDELSSAKALGWHIIGSQAMSRLWNMKQKLNHPDISTYLNVPLDRQIESFKDPNYSFRLLRLLRRHPDFFTQTTSPIQSLEDYLKNLAKNHERINPDTRTSSSTPVQNLNENSNSQTELPPPLASQPLA